MASPFVSLPQLRWSLAVSLAIVKGNQIHRTYIALPAFERAFPSGELAVIQKYEHGITFAAALTDRECSDLIP